MTLTHSNENQERTPENRQVLKLVSPPAKAPEQQQENQLQSQDKSLPSVVPQPTKQSPLQKWTILGAVALSLGGIAYIPLPNYVTGQTQITSREDARQLITMPMSGRVQIHVKIRDRIQPGDLIAEVHSDELNNQITRAEQELEQAKLNLNTARQELGLVQSKLQAAQNNESIARDRKVRQETDLMNAKTSPQVQRLDQEKAGIKEEINIIEAEIFSIQADITGLQGQLVAANKKVQAYQKAVGEGAAPARMLWEMEAEQETIAAAIAQKQAQIEAKQNQIQQKHTFTAAKSEQVNEVIKQFQDSFYRYEDELAQVTAQTQTAQQEVKAATEKIQSQQQLIAKLNDDLTQLKQQRKDLKFYATTAGTVTTEKLDLKNNSYLNFGDEILSIVNLSDLTAEVHIRQEDKDLVREGATANVYRQGDTNRYTAIVENINPVIQLSEKQQKPMLTVQILIDNEQQSLLPGVEGYAHIKTRSLRVYQKVGHEFNKLFNLGKYFPWLTGNREPNS
jgi:multidrug resistance efflux pump